MKSLLILLVPLLLTGCQGMIQYTDPESGISAALTHDFDGKTMKRLRGYAK
jgi:uncharacterized protein YceK